MIETIQRKGEGRRGGGRASVAWWAALLSLGLAGCAPTQMIAVSAGPDPVVVFVDGERVEPVPAELELRANRDHTLFFQRDGYHSQLVVVRTGEQDGEPRLEPREVEVRLKRVATSGPNITVEVDDGDVPANAP